MTVVSIVGRLLYNIPFISLFPYFCIVTYVSFINLINSNNYENWGDHFLFAIILLVLFLKLNNGKLIAKFRNN